MPTDTSPTITLTLPSGHEEELDHSQAVTLRASLSAALRKNPSGGRNGGRPRSCDCGRCLKCRRRRSRS
jgi:hypothetical protein